VDDYSVALPPSSWYDYWTGLRIDPSTGRKGIDNAAISQPEVHIHRTLETLPVFVRAGSIVPEQPLVQSTEEKPQGPLTLRVYPPTTYGAACDGALYLDDGVSYDFKKGDFLRVEFTCRLSAQGLIVTVAPHEGTFSPWWNLLSIEVYGATKPFARAEVTLLDHPAATPVATNFDDEHHRVTALVLDDAKGLQLDLTY
jgi:alpha-glucosidase